MPVFETSTCQRVVQSIKQYLLCTSIAYRWYLRTPLLLMQSSTGWFSSPWSVDLNGNWVGTLTHVFQRKPKFVLFGIRRHHNRSFETDVEAKDETATSGFRFPKFNLSKLFEYILTLVVQLNFLFIKPLKTKAVLSSISSEPRPDRELFQSICLRQELPSMAMSMLLNIGSILICKGKI